MSHPRRPDGSVLPAVAGCDTHCCHPVKPASINGDAKAPDSVGIHQRWGNANGRVTTKEEDEYCHFKFNSAEGDHLYLVFAVATALAQANAEEKFLRIKHAYNTLMNSKSRSKYGSSSSSPDSSWSPGSSKLVDAEEDFYGFGDFLKVLQKEFQNWEAALNSDQKPKSLWEELSVVAAIAKIFCEEKKITQKNKSGKNSN